MGIGNTTTSAAVTAALTGAAAAAVTGRGAGLSTAGLERKIAVIEAALALHKPDSNDSIDVLHKGRRFGYRGAVRPVSARRRSAFRSCWTA